MTFNIEARFIYGSDDECRSGQAVFACPVCAKHLKQRDVVTFWPPDESRSVQICPDCSDAFQKETGTTLESDVIPVDLFESLHKWAVENSQLPG